jgi:hypothetical protein
MWTAEQGAFVPANIYASHYLRNRFRHLWLYFIFAPIPPSRPALHTRRNHVYLRPVLLQYHLRGYISGLQGL